MIKNYIKNLRIVYFMAIIIPVLLIGIFAMTLDKGIVMLNYSINEVFIYLIPILGFVFIPIGFFLFKRQLLPIKSEDNQEKRLKLYRGAFMLRIASIVGITMLAVVAFMLTLNNLFIVYMFMVLTLYIPIYPTINRTSKDLRLIQYSIENISTDKSNKQFLSKNLWIVALMLPVIIYLNYSSFKDLFSNKVILPDIHVDKGSITDSIYHNEYLDWTFVIPTDYKVIPLESLLKAENKGNNILGIKSGDDDETVRLLNISNELVDFNSYLSPRVLFPNINNENKYLDIIEEKFNNAKIESVDIKKQGTGIIQIDSLKFKYIEFILTSKRKVGIIYLVKLNKDFIFNISLVYTDTQKVVEIIKRLKESDLNWE